MQQLFIAFLVVIVAVVVFYHLYRIYICGLVFEWMKSLGGMENIEKVNTSKANKIYSVIDNSNRFYL
jgi:phosphoserine aminotransferase